MITEKEKMLKGELYDANNDSNLINERTNCQVLCHQYNMTIPLEIEQRKKLIKKILLTDREDFLIEQPFHCDYGYNTKIGKNFYSNYNLTLLDAGSITFGDNVFIGPNCGFYTSAHPIEYEIRNQGLEYAFPIKVGNNVWFGGNVTVLPNVTIGDNVVIGAGSVVTKDIPSNTIAVGNPCKVIKKLDTKI